MAPFAKLNKQNGEQESEFQNFMDSIFQAKQVKVKANEQPQRNTN